MACSFGYSIGLSGDTDSLSWGEAAVEWAKQRSHRRRHAAPGANGVPWEEDAQQGAGVVGVTRMEGREKRPGVTRGAGASIHSCDRCFWCDCQVAPVDEARPRVPIKADVVEGIKRKPPQDSALCSNRHADDRADKLDAVTFFQLWC